MKHISELTSTSQKQSVPASIEPVSLESKRIIQELFVVMKSIWGNKYTSQFKSKDDVRMAMRIWHHTFNKEESSVLHEALVRLSIKLDWPPTIKEMKAETKTVKRERQVIPFGLKRLNRFGHTQASLSAIEKMKQMLSRV